MNDLSHRGTQLPTRVQCLCALPFILVLQTPLISKITWCQPFPIPYTEVFSHICNTVRVSCYHLHSFLGSPDLLNYFLYLHILGFILCAVKLYGFWQMHHISYPLLQCHSEQAYCYCALPNFLPPYLPGNHWSLYCPWSYLFPNVTELESYSM